ncbi:hypothetical protein D3C72_2162190 [compost metagenome]
MDTALEYRHASWRSQALAVYNAHAAQALAVRQADEVAQRLARLVGPQAVQVNLALDAPMPCTQLVHHVAANAFAAKAQLFVGIEQRAGIEFVAHGLDQHTLLIRPVLQWQGLG